MATHYYGLHCYYGDEGGPQFSKGLVVANGMEMQVQGGLCLRGIVGWSFEE